MKYMKSLFFSLLSLVSSHLTGISTCTDPAEPGTITFFLATYHSYTGTVVPGTVHIQAPSGTVSTFSLDQSKQANPLWTGPLIMTGSEWDSNIKSTYNYSSDVSCSHFGDKPDGSLTYPALNATERQSCGYNNVYTYYTATLNNAVSGTYRVWLTGTDAVLAYNNGPTQNTPCKDTELVVDLIISDGLNKCNSLPSTTTNGDTPPSYCSNVISGYRCPTQCSSGYYATGYNQCYNGSWTGNFKCYDMLPCLSSDVNNVLNNIDISRVVGITGDGCDFTLANGTKCSLSCVSGFYGSGDVECINGSVVSNNANCSLIVPTPSPTPNPTPSPTPLATPSPTPLATPSPTPLATPSPTPNPTVTGNQKNNQALSDAGYFTIIGFIVFFLMSILVGICCIVICKSDKCPTPKIQKIPTKRKEEEEKEKDIEIELKEINK